MCNQNCLPMKPGEYKNLLSMRFGRLVAIEHLGRQPKINRSHYWKCICDCGTSRIVQSSALIRGDTRSCGCLQREKARPAGDRTRTHGLTGTTTYHIWDSMIQRCVNPARKDYWRYGGSGITVCEKWRKFEQFLADMGERPEGKTLDRKDNEKGYSKDNCRWATSFEQSRNRTDNRLLAYQGETKCLADWAEQVGLKQITLSSRLRYGWSVERAIQTPVRRDARHA